ncbi:MAG TPA: chromosomal replication initiator protein DnaA [Pirellulales bacterium]
MTKDDTEIVSAVLLALADKVGKDRFEMWFGANARIALVADTLRVAVPNQFYQDWLRTNFRRHIEDSCQQVLGRDLPVTFHVDRDLNRPRVASLSAPPAPPGTTTESGVVTEAYGAAGPSAQTACTAQLAVASQVATITLPAVSNRAPVETNSTPVPGRRKFADLASFVSGTGNRLAATSAAEVAASLGSVSPLVIHGPTGVGKTHLLEGIWTAAKRRYPRLHAVYLSAEQFTSYFLEALHTSGVPNFRSKYRGVDLLLIDDLQFFAGKRATLGELLHTIDALTREGRQLVFTADRSPSALAGLGPELTARLSAGLVCRIDTPDYETRLGIVRQQATRLGMELPEKVFTFLADNFRNHARELQGALLKLHATSRALDRPITLALVVTALADSVVRARQPLKLTDVQQAVCEVFGIEPEKLCSARRTSAIAHPRMLAMWLARKHTRAALAEIGEFFGNRSHSTVLSANKKVGEWMNDPQSCMLADHTLTLAEAVRKVEERLRVG